MQYQNTNDAPQDLADPTSDAAIWAAWQKKDHPLANATAASTHKSLQGTLNRVWTTSFCSAACTATSNAEQNWLSDALNLEGDIGSWAYDATSWQITQLSSSVLSQDGSTINSLLPKLPKDVTRIATAM